ncbi:MAG: ATP-dependent sacrificial sulfur transferase LarE [Sphaerochaetaceae bacterium]|nr:ATP-dependent sacrificial sulfur transferase LarE [Sphaerochaetaceae bacterium]
MNLSEFFSENPKVAIAFSGGVDSAYLLCEAVKNGAEVCAYYVFSAFQPDFEREDARRIAFHLGAKMKELEVDVLCDPSISSNPPGRCYYCKKKILSKIISEAQKDGFTTVLDGTNASDLVSDRPGFKALGELKVLSPLRLCGLTKAMIRERSREAGLFTWNKGAYACLATRIPTGEEITEEKLECTEKAEAFLFSLGFKDFRVRYFNGYARIQVLQSDFNRLCDSREVINRELCKYYKGVLLDMEGRNEQ